MTYPGLGVCFGGYFHSEPAAGRRGAKGSSSTVDERHHTDERRTLKKVEIQSDGTDMFVVVDSGKEAKRGRPDTPHAKTWVSLKSGWVVRDVGYPPEEIEIEHNGVRVH